jgi:hypothetical protein
MIATKRVTRGETKRYATATRSISTSAFFGSPDTATVVRAGLWSPKNSV